MAKLEKRYDVNDLPKSDRDFSPLPPGWYDVTITESSQQQTKARNGTYLKLRYDVTGPTHQGRVVFGNLTLTNANPKAEEIGYQQMGELLRAIGLPVLDDDEQLIGKHLSIKLTVKQSPEFGDSNDVKGFRARAGAAPTSSSEAPKKSKAPWEK